MVFVTHLLKTKLAITHVQALTCGAKVTKRNCKCNAQMYPAENRSSSWEPARTCCMCQKKKNAGKMQVTQTHCSGGQKDCLHSCVVKIVCSAVWWGHEKISESFYYVDLWLVGWLWMVTACLAGGKTWPGWTSTGPVCVCVWVGWGGGGGEGSFEPPEPPLHTGLLAFVWTFGGKAVGCLWFSRKGRLLSGFFSTSC